MLNIRGMSTVDSLLGVTVHSAALALHCRTCPIVFLPRGFQVGGCVNARPDPDAVIAEKKRRAEQTRMAIATKNWPRTKYPQKAFARLVFPCHAVRIISRIVWRLTSALTGVQKRASLLHVKVERVVMCVLSHLLAILSRRFEQIIHQDGIFRTSCSHRSHELPGYFLS